MIISRGHVSRHAVSGFSSRTGALSATYQRSKQLHGCTKDVLGLKVEIAAQISGNKRQAWRRAPGFRGTILSIHNLGSLGR